MTSETRDPLCRFVRAVHRRMMIVRALEGAGVGVALSAGMSLILAVLLLWMGHDAMGLCALALVGGGVIGAVWSMRRWPTLLGAAVKADRQLELADLLATAWARRDDADPWQRAVVVTAQERCRTLSPSAVMLARFGTRAWSGIGLSAALVLTIGALSMSPRQTVATTPDVFQAPPRDATRSQTLNTSPSAPTIHRDPSRPTVSAVDEAAKIRGAGGGDAGRPRQGAGSGQTSAQTPSIPEVMPRSSAGKGPDSGVGEVGGGGAGRRPSEAHQTPVEGSETSGNAVSSGESPAAPTSPPEPANAARSEIKHPAIKDQYRDVAQEYFDQH